MTCRECIDFIADFLDGALPEDQRAEFQRHLDVCPDCVAYLDSYRTTVAVAESVSDDADPAPEDMPDDLVEAILRARKRDPS